MCTVASFKVSYDLSSSCLTHSELKETTPSPLQAVFHLAPDKNKHSYQPHPPPLKHKLIKQKLPTFLIVFNFENTSVGDASL